MRELQFSVVVLMVLMSSALIMLLPERVTHDRVINRSRWLMVGALSLLGVQFLIQYVFQLRSMGVTQAVLVNLLFFIPSSALMSLTVLNLQRQGRLRIIEIWGWLAVWIVVTTILVVAVVSDHQPLERVSMRVYQAEVWGSVIYAIMQTCYSFLQFKELIRMEGILENYFDSEHSGLLRWMKHSVGITGLMALFVPMLIFTPNIVLIIYSLIFFWGIFMMWFCFVRYFTSNALYSVREAEESAGEEEQETRVMSDASDAGKQLMEQAVERWLSTGAYLMAGVTSPMAAEEMQIPRYQLTQWVKASGYNSFTHWITSLRVEEAKRVLQQHPDWTNEAVADHCGFSRAYFQKIFKQETGLSPSEFLER